MNGKARLAFVVVILVFVPAAIVGRVKRTIEIPAPASKTSAECSGEVAEILQQIRELMNDADTLKDGPIQAYIVPMNDQHQSEYVADHDKRLQYISKFTGSAGEAVVTMEQAVLWTDSRYHLQADKQLDLSCWTLIKRGQPMAEWLRRNLPRNSSVGVDPFLISEREFRDHQQELKKSDIQLRSIPGNLIDIIWKNQPEAKRNPVFPLDIKYSGKEAGLKITEVLAQVEEKSAEAVVISSLDDIAWLLNLRGTDIDYNPVFFSYVILSRRNSYFFIDADRMSEEATRQLSEEKVNLTIRNYDRILEGVNEIIKLTNGTVVVSPRVSRAIAELIPQERLIFANIVAGMKAVKNRIEAANMNRSHIRDGLALIQYLHWLNATIDDANITEISGAEKLAQFRASQDNFRGLSFNAISAVGENSAIVHYSPTPKTNKRITRDKIYLIDSGGQYWDGTTDITRTVHFGRPKEEEKLCYTRVLKGFIAMGTSIFPVNTSLAYFDYVARRPLWQAGLDYGHGSGHGVGMFLLVHEFPPSLSSKATEVIRENMFTSNEPGYYKANAFGIRIEDVVQVIKSDIPNAFDGSGALALSSITYAPLSTNLIISDMLTKEEANYVNNYNKRVMETIGPILLKHKLMDAYRWLRQETRQICAWMK